MATGNSLRVARFTPLSVACADSTTATSSSNGVLYSSSVVGWGLAARRRLKISWRLPGFIGSGSLVVQALFQRPLLGLTFGARRFFMFAGHCPQGQRNKRVARHGATPFQRRLH